MINELMNKFSDFFKNLKDNRYAMLTLVGLLSLNICLHVKPVQNITTSLISNSYFKFVILIIIAYIMESNPALGILLTITLLITLQTTTYKNLSTHPEENFSPNDVDGNEYLEKPLEKKNSLMKLSGFNYDFKLQTPDNISENMIKNGRLMLDDSMELKNDLKTRYDVREAQIEKITELDGNTLVQSGINRLQRSPNGEYITTNTKKNTSYIKYDNYVKNYMDNMKIKNLYTNMQNKYNELLKNNYGEEDFNKKLYDVYTINYELLFEIYECNKHSLNTKHISDINKIFDEVSSSKLTIEHINKLSSLLL